jgi:membrane-associated phospholipid phosphatase
MDAGASADRWAPDWLNVLGKPVVTIPLSVLLAVLAWRCRVLAIAIPVAITTTGLAVFTLTWLTQRERPEAGAHAHEHNSFPGGHVAQMILLFGVVPLVVQVLTHRRAIRATVTLFAAFVLAELLADTVRTGGHWPSDQLGGALIAVAALILVRARVAEPARHLGCADSCPHRAALDDEGSRDARPHTPR